MMKALIIIYKVFALQTLVYGWKNTVDWLEKSLTILQQNSWNINWKKLTNNRALRVATRSWIVWSLYDPIVNASTACVSHDK